MTGSSPSLFEVVRAAWSETLSLRCFDVDVSWEEAGADSLASLHLIFRLESVLGRKLSFDIIWPEMTATDLVRRLAADPIGETRHDVPTVFLMPGLLGDDLVLATFRRRLANCACFELVDHPDISAPAALLNRITEAGQRAAAEIERRKPEGDVLLMGYCFGGAIAYEAAQALIMRGRNVALLGILDTPFSHTFVQDNKEIERRAREPRSWRFGRALMWRIGRSGLARQVMLTALSRIRSSLAEKARNSLLANFRRAAMRDWDPAPMASPATQVVLAVTEQFGPPTLAAWRRLCPAVEAVAIPGLHPDVLRSDGLRRLAPVFENAVKTATRRTEPSFSPVKHSL